MHEAIINSRDLIILFTEDYLRSAYTRKEFTSFEAERVKTAEERHIIVLRCFLNSPQVSGSRRRTDGHSAYCPF
jgi:hypothetical protein